MTDAKSAWHEASEKFGSLGGKLKTHYEQQRGQEADQAKAEVKDALHRLSGALEDAFEALGKAAKDDAVRTDVKQVGQSLATALGASFTEISGELQRAFANRAGRGAEPEAGEARPPATTEPGGATDDTGAAGTTDDTGAAGTTDDAGAAGATDDAPAGAAGDDASSGGQSPLDHEPPAPGSTDDDPQPPRVEPWGTP